MRHIGIVILNITCHACGHLLEGEIQKDTISIVPCSICLEASMYNGIRQEKYKQDVSN